MPASPETFAAPAAFDPSAAVIYLPVRHHSPACAFHVERVIREAKPDVVLIEGPRDATPLLPLLLDAEAKMPVAICSTFAERHEDNVRRNASYYPLCDYSPELAAVRTADAVGAACELCDLTFPEMVVAGRRRTDAKAQSLMNDRHLLHSRYLDAACKRAGARDSDDLWDGLFESDYRGKASVDFFRGVLTFCAAARHGVTEAELEEDATLPRERAMAATVAAHAGKRLVVVTGGFHTVALPTTKPAMPPAVKVRNGDASVTLMRYGFEQLDRLNGYASGMPSPGFYQHLWDGGDTARLYVDLGRRVRDKQGGVSIADVIAATTQCDRLAVLRRHATPTREDFLDGVRSSLVKGDVEAEGAVVLAMARQMLAGDRVGRVPAAAGQPPIVRDFHAVAASLKVDPDKTKAGDTHLDLYRQVRHRVISRFFQRLTFLDVPFATLVAGPDFVAGEALDRVQEIWRYAWTPTVEATLIERSLYGATVEEAAVGLLVERYAEAERLSVGGTAATAASLVLEACRMGLHDHTPDLLRRTATLVAGEADFAAVVAAAERLLVLHVAAEPLEAYGLVGVLDVAEAAYDRACYLIPPLANTSEAAEAATLAALAGLQHVAVTLGDDGRRRQLRHDALQRLAADGTPTMTGAALGLLHGGGAVEDDALADAFAGRLHEPADAAGFLRGLLATARHAMLAVPRMIHDLHALLQSADEAAFTAQLPQLRLAFSGLTPRETDRLAKAVANHAGGELDLAMPLDVTPADLQQGLAIDRRVREALAADDLLAMIGGDDAGS
jgi:hypothetical protein